MTKKRLLIFGAVLTLLYGFLIGHPDGRTISTWAYDLLSSIPAGQFRNFPAYTYAMHENATNYTLFDNLLTAIMLLPLYLIDRLFTLSLSVYAYAYFEKIFIVLATILSAKLFYDLLLRIKIKKEDALLGVFIFLTSAIVQLSVVGKGQIDIYSLVFCLLAANAFLDEKYVKMSLLFGLAILIKPFPVLIVLCNLLLNIKTYKNRVFLYGILTILPYGLDMLIRRILMPEYQKYSDLTEQVSKELFGATRFESLFNVKLGGISLFPASLILIFLICFFIGMKEIKKPSDDLFYPALTYLSIAAFMSPTLYWFSIILPAIIILLLKSEKKNTLCFLSAVLNVGAILRIYGTEIKVMPSPCFTVWKDVYGFYPLSFLRDHILNVHEAIDAVGTAIFIVSLASMVVLAKSGIIYKSRSGKKAENSTVVAEGEDIASSAIPEKILMMLPAAVLVLDLIFRLLI